VVQRDVARIAGWAPARSGGSQVRGVAGIPTPPGPLLTPPSLDHRKHAKANDQKVHSVANIKSQIKRIRTNEKARLRNKAVKTELKTYVRRVREAIAAGDKESAESALQVASRKLDKAVSKGVIHRNQAANRKSKLARQVNKLA
jgi:small subunit ribosomal protein S20